MILENKKRLITAMLTGVASGLLAGASSAFIHSQSESDTAVFVYIAPIALALTCYLLVALLIRYISSRTSNFPDWPVISVLGTILFVSVRLIPAIVQGWFVPAQLKPSLLQYILTEISAAASVVGFLLLLTLPASGIVAYIVKVLSVRATHPN